jgi:hypothetical protein
VEEMKESFEQYGRENSGAGLKAVEQMARFKKEYGIDIGCVVHQLFSANLH